MANPVISIKQHPAGLYEWKIIWGLDEFIGPLGSNGLQGCLSDAIGRIPKNQKLVEISYRRVHMGTFHAVQIRTFAKEVAAALISRYGAYIDST